MIDSQIEWNLPREFPDLAEPYYGYEGAEQYRRRSRRVLDDYRMVPERFIDAGDDRVLVFSREGGRGKGSGAEVLTHLTAHIWTLKDGKAVRMQSYWERAEPSKPWGCRSKTLTPTPEPAGYCAGDVAGERGDRRRAVHELATSATRSASRS